ncbi:unnamed protein product [Effrenium voratum]|nr:unnamed protein product [Effrenium voratum]CAJ1440045.1 unnamed protein product [Effrenium voratum]
MVSVLEAKPKSRRGGFSQWVKAEVEEKPEPIEEENTLTEEKTDTTTEVDSDDTGASCESVPAKGLADDEQDALRQYTEKFGESRDGTDSGYNRVAFPWFKAQPVQTPQVSTEVLHAALARQPREKKITKQSLWEVDSEGEEVPLCTRCSLPVGEFSYQGREGKQTCVHPECMAQVLIQETASGRRRTATSERA